MKTNPHCIFRMYAFILVTLIGFFFSERTSAETIPSTKEFSGDIKIQITSATASSYQPGNEISLSYDNDKSTIYHSNYSSTTFPVTLTYNFSASDMDYILYTTRQDGNWNGYFKVVEVQTKSTGETAYTKAVEVDLKGTSGVKKIDFPATIKNVTSVKLIVKSGAGDGSGFASCAEMEFYKTEKGGFDPATIFTDASCSAIRAGLTRSQLESIISNYYRTLALALFDQTYPQEFRIQEYKAWPHPDDFSRNNRVGTYSLCDNPTGIFVRQGDTVIVFVNDTQGYNITLDLKNYNKPGGNGYWDNTYYPLYKGANKVIADRDGLFYVFYHTSDHLTAPKIKIHFAFGKANGYYDNQKHSPADWTRILSATQYEYFDVLGAYAHLSFPTAKFKANASTTGPQLIKNYDDLVYAERDLMGYYKFPNRNPYNRSHFVVMYHNYMYSTSYHTGYEVSTMDGLTNAANVRQYPWGPAHEVGHSNQHNPLLKWVGTTEVTNNIQSLYVQTQWGNVSRLTEEGRYQEAFDDLLVPQKAHCEVNIWRKLVPFWQLQLFFSNVLDRNDFYASIYEGCRTRPTGSNQGEYQLNFVKIVTDSAKVDLTEFFNAWGFLKPVNVRVDDYSPAQLTISTSQSLAVKNYIKNKNFPIPPYKIQYITDSNWEIYKNKSTLVKGASVRFGNSYKMSNWQNVVAYEAWQSDTLVNVSQTSEINMVGNVGPNSKVYAVQYDGTKTEVVPDLAVNVEVPKISDENNAYWYYVKNMNNVTPRSRAALTVASAGSPVKGSIEPVLKTQHWKLIKAGNKTALVNESGVYLGADFNGATAPFGWTVENVSQGGSSGYRLATYDASDSLTQVAHLDNNLNIINYTKADAASVWQFVPVENLQLSSGEAVYPYTINSLRFENEVLGSTLACNNSTNTVSSAIGGKQLWKIVNYNASTWACNIVNTEGKYLSTSGLMTVLSETPKALYIYMDVISGVMGYRISSSTSTSSPYSINLKTDGGVNMSSVSSNGILWNFVQGSLTPVENLQADKYRIYVMTKKIISDDKTLQFDVYTSTGQQIRNENLPAGIYIVIGKDFTKKVLVK